MRIDLINRLKKKNRERKLSDLYFSLLKYKKLSNIVLIYVSYSYIIPLFLNPTEAIAIADVAIESE